MERTTHRPLVVLAALAAASTGAATAPPALAGPVREAMLAEFPADASTGATQLQAGFGVVAWTEASPGRKPRLAVRYEGVTRRTTWNGSRTLGVERQVDQRTGRLQVRVVAGCPVNRPSCTARLLSPRTLKPTKSVFRLPTYPFTTRAVDGADAVEITPVAGAPEPSPRPLFSPPSSCTVRLAPSTAALPALPDCSSPSVQFRGGVAVVRSTVPSLTYDEGGESQSVAGAWDVADLRRPDAGWVRLGTQTSNRGGSDGVLQACILDGGVAVLSGRDDDYNEDDPETFSIAVRRTDGSVRWTAPIPQVARSFEAVPGQIACSDTMAYATYITTKGRGKRARTIARVVRLGEPG